MQLDLTPPFRCRTCNAEFAELPDMIGGESACCLASGREIARLMIAQIIEHAKHIGETGTPDEQLRFAEQVANELIVSGNPRLAREIIGLRRLLFGLKNLDRLRDQLRHEERGDTAEGSNE